MKLRGYLWVGFATTLNIILNAVTLGHYLWLEGRVCCGKFRNWARRFRYTPPRFCQPTTEDEIIELVEKAKSVRVFGSGHSFNRGIVTDEVLVSLDRYCGVVRKDLDRMELTVRSGTRVRDVIKALLEEGLAFEALPSHDAQSIAGILSTDVHGTGRNWGFVSDSVVSLKLIDGKGEVHDDLRPSDDLFKAAIGGVGAVGIILEVTVKAVKRFKVEQKFEIADLAHVEAHLHQLLEENDHFSLYLFPFANNCQISTWNVTPKEKSFLGPLREFLAISLDALLGAWFGGFLAYAGLLPRFSTQAHSFKQGTDLVMESNRAFNRTIYHLHQELEFTVPREQTFDMCRRFINLYEKTYRETKLPYTLFEIRFTPKTRAGSLIGPGRERLSTWIDLVCNDSAGFETYYAEAEKLIKQINTDAGESVKETGVRPHLGKFCKSLDSTDMEKLHGEHFRRFRQLVRDHDPEGKFANGFTRRLFGV